MPICIRRVIGDYFTLLTQKDIVRSSCIHLNDKSNFMLSYSYDKDALSIPRDVCQPGQFMKLFKLSEKIMKLMEFLARNCVMQMDSMEISIQEGVVYMQGNNMLFQEHCIHINDTSGYTVY